MTRVEGQAGDCILFTGAIESPRLTLVIVSVSSHRFLRACGISKTFILCALAERLVHSTLPWTGSGERRSLFIKCVTPIKQLLHASTRQGTCLSSAFYRCTVRVLRRYVPYGMHYRDTVYDTTGMSPEDAEVVSFPETGWLTKPFEGIAFTDPENNLPATAKL